MGKAFAQAELDLGKFKHCIKRVSIFFGGSTEKTVLWFITPNPLLGNMIPTQFYLTGRVDNSASWRTQPPAGVPVAGLSVLDDDFH